MKETKKAKLRNTFKWLGLLLCVTCYLILPILKLFNVYDISWFKALIPLMFGVGCILFFLLGYFIWWLVQPGED